MAKIQTDSVETPEFRASYVKLAQPDSRADRKTGEDVPVYGLVMVFPPEADLTALREICKQAKTLKWGDKPPSYVKSPLRRGVQKSEADPNGFDLQKNPFYEGCTIVSANSVGIKPDVRDHNVEKIADLNEVYSGCYCKAKIVAYGYEPRKGDSGGSYGIAIGLQAVQKTRNGEKLAGMDSEAGRDFAPYVAPTGSGYHDDLLAEV